MSNSHNRHSERPRHRPRLNTGYSSPVSSITRSPRWSLDIPTRQVAPRPSTFSPSEDDSQPDLRIGHGTEVQRGYTTPRRSGSGVEYGYQGRRTRLNESPLLTPRVNRRRVQTRVMLMEATSSYIPQPSSGDHAAFRRQRHTGRGPQYVGLFVGRHQRERDAKRVTRNFKLRNSIKTSTGFQVVGEFVAPGGVSQEFSGEFDDNVMEGDDAQFVGICMGLDPQRDNY